MHETLRLTDETLDLIEHTGWTQFSELSRGERDGRKPVLMSRRDTQHKAQELFVNVVSSANGSFLNRPMDNPFAPNLRQARLVSS